MARRFGSRNTDISSGERARFERDKPISELIRRLERMPTRHLVFVKLNLNRILEQRKENALNRLEYLDSQPRKVVSLPEF